MDSIVLNNGNQIPILMYGNDMAIFWKYAAILEMGIIILLIIIVLYNYKRANVNKQMIKSKTLNEDVVDFNNILTSAFYSKDIYNKLKIKCHPDLYVNDEEKSKKALEIFQELRKNEYNYQELLLLKKRAETELNVKL